MIVSIHSPAIPKPLQVCGDSCVLLLGFSLLLAQRRGETLHLLLERLAVVLGGLGADVAAGGEDVAVLGDFGQGDAAAEAGDVLVCRGMGVGFDGLSLNGLGCAGFDGLSQNGVGGAGFDKLSRRAVRKS